MRYILSLLIISTLLFSNIKLSQKDALYIAKKVWQNEGAGLDKYLIHWNKGEDFASIGIGHFIWFSRGHKERFREVFPMYLKFVAQKRVKMPRWLTPKTPLPWHSSKELAKAKKQKSKKYRELFKFIKNTRRYQAEFMANRLTKALPQILKTLHSKKQRSIITKRFNHILYKKNGSIDKRGLYILIDYTNFKGEGTLKSERYQNQGWGLLQVLQNLNPKQSNKYRAFASSAKKMLLRRVKNSPKARGEKRWTRGWNIRLRTYWR